RRTRVLVNWRRGPWCDRSKDEEIGVLALIQFAFHRFLEQRVSRTRGIGTDAIVERDFLLRLPAVSRIAFRAFARNVEEGVRHHVRRRPKKNARSNGTSTPSFKFEIAPSRKEVLLKSLDDIGTTLQLAAQ